MYKLVLIRHGESTWNLENRFTGWTDVELTPTGISPQNAVMLMNREKAFVLDVSPADTFAQGSVTGARNIPLADLAGGKGLPGKKDQVILVVSPDGRDGVKAAAQLKALGHENVQVVGGGLKAWVAANLPLQRKG